METLLKKYPDLARAMAMQGEIFAMGGTYANDMLLRKQASACMTLEKTVDRPFEEKQQLMVGALIFISPINIWNYAAQNFGPLLDNLITEIDNVDEKRISRQEHTLTPSRDLAQVTLAATVSQLVLNAEQTRAGDNPYGKKAADVKLIVDRCTERDACFINRVDSPALVAAYQTAVDNLLKAAKQYEALPGKKKKELDAALKKKTSYINPLFN